MSNITAQEHTKLLQGFNILLLTIDIVVAAFLAHTIYLYCFRQKYFRSMFVLSFYVLAALYVLTDITR